MNSEFQGMFSVIITLSWRLPRGERGVEKSAQETLDNGFQPIFYFLSLSSSLKKKKS